MTGSPVESRTTPVTVTRDGKGAGAVVSRHPVARRRQRKNDVRRYMAMLVRRKLRPNVAFTDSPKGESGGRQGQASSSLACG